MVRNSTDLIFVTVPWLKDTTSIIACFRNLRTLFDTLDGLLDSCTI